MNRFAEMDRYLRQKSGKPCGPGLAARPGSAPARAMSTSYATPFAAADRALVILIDNGGTDLGIPSLVEKVLSKLPGASIIPDSYKQKLVTEIQNKLLQTTDKWLEDAELAANRFSSAAPGQFSEVAILRDSTASYNDLKSKLISLSKAGKIIDLFVLTHGADGAICVQGNITADKIKAMKTENGKALSIRAVYMMNCWGKSLIDAWLEAGAKAVSGTGGINYLPEPTMFFVWSSWKAGKSFHDAVLGAYMKTIGMMNDIVRGFISSIPLPGTSALAGLVDFGKFDFAIQSKPVIGGDGTVTINSDSLTFGKSLSQSLMVTVAPAESFSATYSLAASVASHEVSNTFSYHSPSFVMQSSEYSYQQNPGVLVIAGAEIAVADAVQIGLGAAAMVQSQVAASQGSFSLVYDKAQRLLTSEARAQMPGSQTGKKTYTRRLLYIGAGRWGTAQASIDISWEGNAYGEIGTPVIQRNLEESTEWSKSAANVTVTKVDRIPGPRTDPRTWPLVYVYEGTFDPVGNGYFEFNGEFEINAFGGIKVNKHLVKSRAALDFAVMGKPEEYVIKAQDVIVPVPVIPDEQVAYLKTKLP